MSPATPNTAHISLYGIRYTVDLETCRMRLLERVAELRNVADGSRRKGGMQVVAEAAGVDRATLRRFLKGERLTVETFTTIITRGLQLDMRTVLKHSEAA